MTTKNKREQLHEVLCDILGNRNCYFSAPSNTRLQYPCIIYEAAGEDVRHADNIRYFHKTPYTITVIDHDPESVVAEKLFNSDIIYLSHDRTFVSDGLYHFIFSIYY